MPMPSYPIFCYSKDCKNLAAYKIAAAWSDGVQKELKTYGLVCGQCLPEWFRRSRAKQKACHLAHGETLELPGIYKIERGLRDLQLQRLQELEQSWMEK